MKRLQLPIEEVKGVGPKTAELLHAAGMRTVEDLIYFLPRKHEDYTNLTKLRDIQPGKVIVQGQFSGVAARRFRRGMTITEAVLSDGTAQVPVVWFNQPYRAKQIAESRTWNVSGEFNLQGRKYQIVNPSVETARGDQTDGEMHETIVPIYRQVQGLKTALIQKIISELRPVMTMLPETLPTEVIQREKLFSHADAIVAMHFPTSRQQLDRARERLGFEELFALFVAAIRNKQTNAALTSWQIPFDAAAARDFASHLPFTLTDAQRVAAWEIIQNFEKGEPMNRLLQGDVGSGKTVVAGMAAFLVAKQGYQTALMAPTELLAQQHAATLESLLQPQGITAGLLTGSLKVSQKKQLYERIAAGDVDVVVGTHALIQSPVQFARLGFVVIDEQHRFGVAQRQTLLDKGERMPHLLAMTATPIPRSLQLTVYGDLDISLLRECPQGRLPIITEIHSPNSRAQVYERIDAQIADGRQVYVICPLISDGKDTEQKSVESELRLLKGSVFRHRRIGLLHGQLPADQKQQVMQAFATGELDILVSTTVVEVGVDVPNATAMIIEGADRFGLAQLHQLRGRVGRSSHQSYCFLIPTTSDVPSRRLREIERSNDGFYLAEKDLELRGPGEIYGRAQHGALNLSIANLTDTVMLSRVKKAAEQCVESGLDLLQYERLWRDVEHYQRLTTLN